MKKPFRYYGGKGRIMPELLKLIPTHHTYVEVFGGSGALLFQKSKSDIEVYNDLDHDLVNFYRMLRDDKTFEDLVWKISLTPYAREEYEDALKELDSIPPFTLERAYRWYVLAGMCVSGVIKGGWAHDRQVLTHCRDWAKMPENLVTFHKRLRFVQIDNYDFRELIKVYDGRDTFFYCDPPYVKDVRESKDVYEHEMSLADHQDLVNVMLASKGKFLLSGYEHPVYNLLTANGWKRRDFEVSCGIKATAREEVEMGERETRTETVWFNYGMGVFG